MLRSIRARLLLALFFSLALFNSTYGFLGRFFEEGNKRAKAKREFVWEHKGKFIAGFLVLGFLAARSSKSSDKMDNMNSWRIFAEKQGGREQGVPDPDRAPFWKSKNQTN